MDNQGICLNMLLAAPQGCHPPGCSSPGLQQQARMECHRQLDPECCPLSQAVPTTASAKVLPLEPPAQTTPNPTSQIMRPPWHCSQLQSPICPCHCSSMAPWSVSRMPLWRPELGTWGLTWYPRSWSRTPIPHHSCWQGKSLLSQQAADGIPCPSHPPASWPQQTPGRRQIPSRWHTQHC